MSDRISQLFAQTRRQGRAALLPYLMLGYPDMDTSLRAAEAALAAGADGLELGIPFSDPLADGPTIQQAGDVALQRGMSLQRGLEMIATLRQSHAAAPFFLMSYLNPLLAFGLEPLCRNAAAAGVDGLIVPDLPPEEEYELAQLCKQHGSVIVHLLAPTSTASRVIQVAGQSQGMLYLVSVTGVTGARATISDELETFVQRVRAATSLPLAVGFGISTPEQAKRVGQLADGVIVGSALIRCLEAEGIDGVRAFVQTLQKAMTT